MFDRKSELQNINWISSYGQNLRPKVFSNRKEKLIYKIIIKNEKKEKKKRWVKINPKFFFHKKGHKTYELLARKWNLNEHVYLNWNPHLSTGTNQTKWEKSQKHEKWETKKAKKKRITVSDRKHAAKRKFTSSTPSTSLYLIQKVTLTHLSLIQKVTLTYQFHNGFN